VRRLERRGEQTTFSVSVQAVVTTAPGGVQPDSAIGGQSKDPMGFVSPEQLAISDGCDTIEVYGSILADIGNVAERQAQVSSLL